MAASKTSQGNVRKTKNRTQFFFETIDTDKAAWDALFAPTYDLNAHQWRAGHEVVNVTTGMRLIVGTVQGALGWISPNVVTKTAVGAITKNKIVIASGANGVAPQTSQGEPYVGVALNNAANGERVYVAVMGQVLALKGTGGPAAGLNFTGGAGADAGKTDAVGSGDFYQGLVSVQTITIATVAYSRVSLSGNLFVF